MNIVQLVNYLIVGGIIVLMIMIYFLKRMEIHSFLWPSYYVRVEMLELDNNTREWIQKKNSDLRFEFNKGYYNLFHQSKNEDGTLKQPAIYREGRLAKFFYHEGFSDPIDFRQGKITGNPQINRQYEEIQISRLFEENNSFGSEFMRKYGIFIIIGIAILVIYLLVRKPEQVVQQMQTVKGG